MFFQFPACGRLVVSLAILWFGLSRAGASEVACFYALDADLASLQKAGNLVRAPKSVAGQQVTTIQIGANSIRAVKMGSGCVQTAITAAAILSRFPCDLAISIGPAGRLSDQVAVGEWVRVAEVVAYQQGSETKTGFVLGQNATRKLEDPWPADVSKPFAGCRSVRLASGELFIASSLFREQLRGMTEAPCVDMNLAGLAAACAEAGVPLRAWKVISDSADDSASSDFQAFVKTYEGEGGRRVGELIKALPPDPNDPAAHSHLKSLLDSASKPAKE